MSKDTTDPRLVGTFYHFCERGGRIITKPRDIERGYGPACWKTVKPRPVKPYIQEVPFTESALVNDDGSVEHLARVYGEFIPWGDSF